MEYIYRACILISMCLMLGGCGSDTQVYLENGKEKPAVEDTQTDIVQSKEQTENPIVIYVCGEVQNPGVYELVSGMRICDAVEVAGGLTEKASREYWNLAELLTDGQMIYFPTEEEAQNRQKSADEAKACGALGSSDGKVNINTAGSELLQTIPGIGQTRAEAILSYRDEHGSFSKVEDIMKVSGIKDALFQKMRDYITVN